MIFTDFDEALKDPLAVKTLHLVRKGRLKKLLPQISIFENLEEFKMDNCSIAKIPSEIGDLPKLKLLTIDRCGYDFKAYPDEIGNLITLEELYLGTQRVETLPESIGNLINLKIFKTDGLRVEYLPESMAKLQNLRSLIMPNVCLEKLPTCLKELIHLEELSISVFLNGEQKPFPDDFFENFKALKSLALRHCNITYSSKSIGSLNQLEKLSLSENKFLSFPLELLNLKKLRYQLLISENKGSRSGTTVDLGSSGILKVAIEESKYKIDLKEAACYFGYLAKYEVEGMNSSTLLGALTLHEPPKLLPINAMDYVVSNYEKEESTKLNDGHNLAIFGTYKISKKDLKICKEAGINILDPIIDTIPENCTHVLLGKDIPRTNKLEADSCQLMAPKNFVDWLNSKKENLYLINKKDESVPEMQENVLELLDTGKDENIKIALSIMDAGGVPENVISLLFIMSKMDHNATIERKAKNW